jgi:L-fuconolactonase
MSTTPSSAISAHLAVRPDWLARRREAALEPELPIIDPHHHLIDRPESGTYLLADLLADIDSGHNVVATVYLEWLSMYRADGPEEMRPVGEIEFANGVAAMSASGGYGKPRVCAGIVGHGEVTAASAASASSPRAIQTSSSGAPSPHGRRAGCSTGRCARASRSSRRWG